MLLSLGVQANFDGNLNPKLVWNIPSTNHMMVKTKENQAWFFQST